MSDNVNNPKQFSGTDFIGEREAMLAAVVEHLGPHALTHGKMSVFDAFCLGWKSRADLAAAREQELIKHYDLALTESMLSFRNRELAIIRATLEHVLPKYTTMWKCDMAQFDPATILNTLEVKK